MANSDGQVVIKIDDSDVKKGITTLDDYQKALNNLNSNSFVQNTDEAGNSVQKLVERLDVDIDIKNFNTSIKEGEKYLQDLALAGHADSKEFKKVAASVRAAKEQVESARNVVKQATTTTQDATKATNELQQANQNVKFSQVSSGANALTGALKQLVGAYIGIRGAQLAFQKTMEAVQAFRTQERAIASLNTTLKNAGVFTPQYSRDIQALASEIQKYSNYGDEAIIKAQALGQSFAGQIPFTQAATKAVVDFAAATGMDLEQAFALVGKSIGSSTNALGRYSVELQKGMTDAQKMDAITRQLTERYAGQARQMANTSTQLKNAMGDLSETIGKIFNPTVEKTESLLIRATNALNKWLQTGIAVNKATNAASLEELYTKSKYNIERIAELEATGLVKGSGNVATYERLKKEQDEVLKRIKQIKDAEKATRTTLKPIKMSDDNIIPMASGTTGGGSVQKIKDDYEKLQGAVSKARREIELAAIAHGTSSIEVQNAFTKYRQLNGQLSAISDLFNTEKKKVDETKTEFQKLNEKIQETKEKIQELYLTEGQSENFYSAKNQLIALETQVQDMNTAISSRVGIDWENVTNSIKSNLSSALLTPLQEGESAFQRLQTIGLNAVQLVGQEIIKNLLQQITLEKTLAAIRSIGKGLSAIFSNGTSLVGDIGSFAISANGNVFQNGNVIPFAKGGVVNKPTIFPMANGGTGLMGEAGAEAVMPLRRMSNGRLGVEAENGNGKAVNVNIYNQSGASVETRKRDDGSMDIFIRRVNEALSNERTSSGFRSAYAREDRKGVQAV